MKIHKKLSATTKIIKVPINTKEIRTKKNNKKDFSEH